MEGEKRFFHSERKIRHVLPNNLTSFLGMRVIIALMNSISDRERSNFISSLTG